MLAKVLYGGVTRENVHRLLSQPIHVPTLPFLPDWVYVKRYIEHHPDFIEDPARRSCWRNSDRSTTDRRKLVREFGAAVCGPPPKDFILLTARLMRQDGEVLARVLRDFDRAVVILDDPNLRPSEKRGALISLLGKQKGAKLAAPGPSAP
jgi:hypothetical protein